MIYETRAETLNERLSLKKYFYVNFSIPDCGTLKRQQSYALKSKIYFEQVV